jgi:hypothetical protein
MEPFAEWYMRRKTIKSRKSAQSALEASLPKSGENGGLRGGKTSPKLVFGVLWCPAPDLKS